MKHAMWVPGFPPGWCVGHTFSCLKCTRGTPSGHFSQRFSTYRCIRAVAAPGSLAQDPVIEAQPLNALGRERSAEAGSPALSTSMKKALGAVCCSLGLFI